MLKPARESSLREIILLSLCIAVAYFSLNATGIFDVPRLKTTDLFSRLAHKIKTPPPLINQITLVKIDDESYQKLGQRWPWRRDPIALFLRKLKDYHPKIICLDFAFVGEATPEEDRLLSGAMKEAGNVFIISYHSPTGEYVLPQKIFSESAFAWGFIDKLRDKDNVLRRTTVINAGRTPQGELKTTEYSLELKIISKYLGIPFENIRFDDQKQRILLKALDKEIHIPLREDMSMLINYPATLEQFHTIPFWKVIKGMVSKEDFEGRIVILGETSEIFHDIHPTPLGPMPGMVILANNLLMLLNRNFIRGFGGLSNFLVLIFLCLGAGIATHRFSLLKGLVVVGLEVVGFGLVSLYLSLQNWQWDTFSPIFGVIATYSTVSLYEYLSLLKEAASLQTLAITDGLTGLFVHRYFQVRLQYEFDRVQRYGGDLALAMIDLDHFKDFNDTYGHEGGNAALKTIAKVLHDSSRNTDILARYGGEEFCIILPQINLQGALNYAERLRKKIEKLEVPITGNKKAKVTISIGIASFLPDKIGSPGELIERTDKALYEAKRNGRNRVCFSDSTTLKETSLPGI